MDRIEENLKERFSDQEFTNDGFNSESLWDKIEGDLDQTTPASSAVKKYKGITAILSLLLFTTVSLYLYYSYNTNNSHLIDVLDKKFNSQIATVEKDPIEIAESQNSPSINNIQKNRNNLSHTLKNSIETLSSSDISSNINQSSTTETAATNIVSNHTSTETTVTKNFLNRNSDTAPIQESEIENQNSSNINKNTFNANTSSIADKEIDTKANSLAILDTKAIPTKNLYLQSSENNKLSGLEYLEKEESEKASNINFEVSIIGGLNNNNFRYRSENAANIISAKESNESGITGYTFGVESSVILKEKYSFTLGLEYNQLWSKLDYDHTKTTQEQRSNQLLKVWVNSTTGDTIRTEQGDAIITSATRRRVVHYNSYKRFSIPLEIGIRKQYHKLEYGIRAGTTLNFTTSQAGRTIDQELNIVDFDKRDLVAPFSSFDLGFRLNPFIGFKYTDQIILRVHPQWAWISGNQFDGTNINTSIHQFNVNIGINYRFK